MAKKQHQETLAERRRKAIRFRAHEHIADPRALTAKEWQDWAEEIHRDIEQKGRKATRKEMTVIFTQLSLFTTSEQRDEVAKTAEEMRRGLTPAHSPEVLHARMTW